MRLLAILSILLFTVCLSCKKVVEQPDPENPYSKVDYGPTANPNPINLDPNTIQGIHKTILQPKCANPGCHDGHFEPDFRTIQSSYYSMVWNKVIKNNSTSSFKFRVVPYDFQKSWLHERLITGDAALGRMPLYSTPLSAGELNQIKTWINNGAKDMFGNSPRYPNAEPQIQGYIMTNNSFQIRYDTTRVGGVFYNPILLPPSISAQNTTVNVLISVTDDSTDINQLQNVSLKLSNKPNDFSAPYKTINGQFLNSGSTGIWRFPVTPIGLPNDSIIFMRVYLNDGDHPTNTEFPTNNLQYEYKTYWSFILD